MKTPALLSALTLFTLPLSAQEVIKAADIEKEMGLAPAPKTRSFSTQAAKAAASVGRVVQRAAAATGATLQTLKRRGVTVVPVGNETANAPTKISVPVLEQGQASFKNILFLKDSTELANEASAAQIAEIARVMVKYPDRCFVVEGHTCDLGSDGHNERLSVERSAAVEARLLNAGVRPEQVVALGFGESDPVALVSPGAPASDYAAETARRQNRRVVIRVQAPAQ